MQNNKSILFVAIGVSSYILTKENNDYMALITGSRQNLQGGYQHTARYFLADLNVSAGHEHKTVKQTRIRIEPCLQISLKGICVGALLIFSAGFLSVFRCRFTDH